jgi:hypothetical protein
MCRLLEFADRCDITPTRLIQRFALERQLSVRRALPVGDILGEPHIGFALRFRGTLRIALFESAQPRGFVECGDLFILLGQPMDAQQANVAMLHVRRGEPAARWIHGFTHSCPALSTRKRAIARVASGGSNACSTVRSSMRLARSTPTMAR